MDPPAKRRRLTPPVESNPSTETAETASQDDQPSDPSSTTQAAGDEPSHNMKDRMSRFKALKSRATASARSNLAESKAEANRAAVDPSVLSSLSRRSAIASHNLLKADTEEEGGQGAFERKRAWDYTIEESEKWDERVERKKNARNNNAFQDYSAEAGKIYDRQIRDLEKAAAKDGNKTLEDYESQKASLIESAARSGNLEIVEMENGEMVAIDREGRFFARHEDDVGFTEQRPKKENVDRLVNDLKKAEEVRMKKRRERGKEVDEGDVTYINDKNKQFNLKLARFYDRYTTDIRESFERGTAI